MSRKHRRPLRVEKGRASNSSVEGSFDVTAVRPLEPVVLERLLDLPVSNLVVAAARASAAALWRACLRSALFPDVEEDFRLAWASRAAALALLVWLAECL